MRILIAEDSLTQAVDLRRRLQTAGHEVTVAADGQKAWEMLWARPVPLIISDWIMPEMSGLDLCRKIRAEMPSPYVYFILLTAKAHRHERLQGLSAGADDFLTKPVDSVELEIALRTAQRIISAQESLQSQATALQRQNEELSRQATHDPLTGLRNACGLEETLASACLQASTALQPLTLIRMEVDGFEWLPAGPDTDEILVGASQLLRDVIGEADIASRSGDHGFALILKGKDSHSARTLADHLRASFSDRIGTALGLSASIAVASWSPGNELPCPSRLLQECEAELAACLR